MTFHNNLHDVLLPLNYHDGKWLFTFIQKLRTNFFKLKFHGTKIYLLSINSNSFKNDYLIVTFILGQFYT